MLKRFFCGILLLCCAVAPSQAFWHGASGVGKAQLNLGANDLTAQLPTNLFEMAQVTFTVGTNSPASVDANNFPIANFSGLISGQLGAIAGTPITTGPWLLAWDAGRSCFQINFIGNAATITNVTHATVVNGAGSGDPSITGNCSQAGSVTINFNTTATITYQWDGTYTQWASNTTGKFYLARSGNIGWGGQSDAVAYATNGIFWTTEAVNFIKALKPESIRPMGWNILTGPGQTGTNVVNFSYRKTTTAFSFEGSDYPPGTRCGGTTSFCTISNSNGALTAAAPADTNLSGWVDGEQLTGNVASNVTAMTVTAVASNGGNCQFTVSPGTAGLTASNPVMIFGVNNTLGNSMECNGVTTISSVDNGTQFTIPIAKTTTYSNAGWVGYQTLAITGKSGGAKLISNVGGTPIGSSFDSLSSGFGTFTYNSTLGRVLYSAGGISNSIPIEAQVQLANLINANYWYNLPTWANNTFATSAATLIRSGLNGALKLIWENGNEEWNFAQDAAQWSTQMGVALGLTTNAPEPFQSLRIRQVNGLVTGIADERLYCFQAGGGGTSFATNPMQGSLLASFGYNAFPNRPIDFTDSTCIAPYVGGGSALSGQSSDVSPKAPTSFDAAVLNSIVSNWNGGSQAAAIATIDGLIRGDILNRVQAVTASGTTFTTPLAHNYSVNDEVRFTVSGGTTYSGLNLNSPYLILSTPTSSTFTAAQIVNGAVGSAVNAGTAGSGTTSVGFLTHAADSQTLYGNSTIFGLMSGAFTKYQNMNATGFSPAPLGGTPGLRFYEANNEVSAPTVAQCAAIGINSTDCATLGTAVNTGWKFDVKASATQQYYFGTSRGQVAGTITTGAMPNAKAPSQLVLMGAGLYGLNSNFSYTAPAVYQTFNGFAAFSGN